MRIGLFGGTFDPIHNGHLNLAEEARKKLRLDKVVFIPAYVQPLKSRLNLSNAEDRFEMVEAAIKGKPAFEVSRYEIDKRNKSYTIDTVEYFKRLYPKGTEFFFLIGADSLKGLGSWKDMDKLLKLCRFVVFNRRGFTPLHPKSPSLQTVDEGQIKIKSSGKSRSVTKELCNGAPPLGRGVTGFKKDIKYEGVKIVDIAPVDISSTQIRRMAKKGDSISTLVPKPVEDYIRVKNLYKGR